MDSGRVTILHGAKCGHPILFSDLSKASLMDSNNKTNHDPTGGTPKFTNAILMIVGVTVGIVLVLISLVACIVNRRLKNDRVSSCTLIEIF
jgi:hypothetical protein